METDLEQRVRLEHRYYWIHRYYVKGVSGSRDANPLRPAAVVIRELTPPF
jgi:hypothetical protein